MRNGVNENNKIRKVKIMIPFTLTLGSRHYGAGEVMEVTDEELKGQEHKVEYLDKKEPIPAESKEAEESNEDMDAEELPVEENRAVEEPVKVAPRVRKATIPKKRKK